MEGHITMHRNSFGQLVLPPRFRSIVDDAGGGGGSEFKAPESQEALDKIIQDRVARATQKAKEETSAQFKGYDDFKAKAEKLAEIENGKKSPDEQLDARLTAAEQRAQKAEQDAATIRNELISERVQGALKNALDGRALKADALFGFKSDAFVNEGAVDADAIKAWVESNSTEVKTGQQRVPGQGDRDANATGGTVQSGRDLYDNSKKTNRKE